MRAKGKGARSFSPLFSGSFAPPGNVGTGRNHWLGLCFTSFDQVGDIIGKYKPEGADFPRVEDKKICGNVVSCPVIFDVNGIEYDGSLLSGGKEGTSPSPNKTGAVEMGFPIRLVPGGGDKGIHFSIGVACGVVRLYSLGEWDRGLF